MLCPKSPVTVAITPPPPPAVSDGPAAAAAKHAEPAARASRLAMPARTGPRHVGYFNVPIIFHQIKVLAASGHMREIRARRASVRGLWSGLSWGVIALLSCARSCERLPAL